MTAPRRSADQERAYEQGVAAERARNAQSIVDGLEKFRATHIDLHTHLEQSLSEIDATIRQTVIIPDPALRERAPALLEGLATAYEGATSRKAFWQSWRGKVTYVAGIAVAAASVLTAMGVLPIRHDLPTVPAPSVSSRP
ncbi:MAG: hypothetical protein ABR598_07675 [Candidatus Dormibacteria bacterium]